MKNLSLSTSRSLEQWGKFVTKVLLAALFLFPFGHITLAQTTTRSEQLVKGVVKAQDDQLPLFGVNVSIKGTSTGVLTDDKGQFELSMDLAKNDILVFTYVGMKTQEYSVSKNASAEINILMEIHLRYIDEIIISGEGATTELYTEKKSGSRKTRKLKGI